MRISDWSSDVCSSDLLAQVSAGGGAAENRAHPLPRGRAGLGMGYGGDDFEHLLAPADLRRAEREIGAFVEGDVELDAAIGAADVEHMQLGNRTLAKGELYLPNRAFILHDPPAPLAAFGHP